MSAHFLLTAASRGFGLLQIMAMSDAEVVDFCSRAKWPDTQGAAVCPWCNMPGTGPDARRRYKCKWCRRHFTLTSGTALHGAKLSLRQLILAVFIWAGSVKGTSALQVARLLNVQHRTAYILCHKLRYGLLIECAGRKIGGDGKECAMDGVYTGGHVRPANYRKNRRDRRLARNRSDKRQVVTIARELGDGGRTILNVAPTEAGSVKHLARYILPGTTIHVDEAASWNDLDKSYEVLRINHQEAYSHAGACTNAAESLFSRYRKLERGQHHHIAGPYLQRYAVEVAFREDHRRLSQLELTMLILHLALTCGPDPAFKSGGTKAPVR